MDKVPLTIASVALTHPTEIQIILSDGSNLRLTLEQIQSLQETSGTHSTFERSGEP